MADPTANHAATRSRTEAANALSEGLVEQFDLDGREIELTPEAIWGALERGGFSRSETVIARLDALMPLALSLIEPRALGRLCRTSSLSDLLPDTLPAPIREAEYLCFCLSTAGRAIDERARALCDEGELVDSMILDGVAMTGLSLIGERLARSVFEWASERGLAASRSFSPGAGASGWRLERQRFIFDHLPAGALGVELTPHFLMRPSKSVSFVVGIGGRVKQAAHPFSCEGCDRFDCAYRHVPDGVRARGPQEATRAGARDEDRGGRGG